MSFSPWFDMILVCAASFLICCLQLSIAGNNETDLAALREIKARVTHDPLGAMSSWNDTRHFCEWHGVSCGRRHRRVTALDLSSLKLTGTLSPSVGNLSFLRVLRLYNNSFSGKIRPELGRLHRLRYLYLQNNSFGGEIPSNISGCSNLIAFGVTYNELLGRIPPGLGSMVNLQGLFMEANNLTGTIPPSLGNLTSLVNLAIGQNDLIGTIPASLGRLKRLTILSLFTNRLSGIVPPSIFNLSTLTSVDLGVNLLEGSLPLNFGNMLSSLRFFSIGSNQFSGSIPASISNSSNLEVLELAANNFHGPVPSLHKLERLRKLVVYENFLGTGQPIDLIYVSSLANATMLDTLEISANYFGGSFPRVVCNFSMLSVLGLDTNTITGKIPICIGSLTYLQVFDAGQNQLSGVIPSSIGKLQSLGNLNLGDNLLSGNIPSNMGNLTLLTYLILSQNHLQGHIPSILGNYPYLLVLDLSQNNLTGGIPWQLFGHSPLSYGLNLSNNPLGGSLPMEIGQLKNLGGLDVSNSKLSGEIPSTLGDCTSLQTLYMAQNLFRGPIPETCIKLKGLNELDLSLNNLSGEIPNFLAALPVRVLNLSYNNLQGDVPMGGVFNNVTGLSIVGNSRLCGGIPELKLPACSSVKNQKRKLGHKNRLIVAIVSSLLGVILLATLVSSITFCHKKKRKETDGEFENSLPNLSYQSLLKATDGFSSENLIGSGTFGAVYRGTLDDQDRTKIVAIKVFNLEHRAASKSFLAECEVLRNVRHRNLVKVVTACSGIDYQGNDFKALVYEYMVNGSLEDWLHQKPTSSAEGTRDVSRSLNFLQRLDIAVDVAFALEYLHHRCGASIVHCDLKPSNVLLDDDMVAHVGDFGLAKFLSQGITSSSANQSSSFGVRGTIGYAPPEYGTGNEPSTYGDVYSFGILLLEIFTGKRPTDKMFEEGLSLDGFVKAALPDNVMEVVDNVILKGFVGDDINTDNYLHNSSRNGIVMLEALSSVLGIALSCSTELPHDRLDITDVAAKLSAIRSKLHRIRTQRQRRNRWDN